MNKKKIISTILACAMLPFGGLISASAQDTKPTYVQLNPADASPFNNGEFQGWGTALCWWANRLGYSENLPMRRQRHFSQTKDWDLTSHVTT